MNLRKSEKKAVARIVAVAEGGDKIAKEFLHSPQNPASYWKGKGGAVSKMLGIASLLKPKPAPKPVTPKKMTAEEEALEHFRETMPDWYRLTVKKETPSLMAGRVAGHKVSLAAGTPEEAAAAAAKACLKAGGPKEEELEAGVKAGGACAWQSYDECYGNHSGMGHDPAEGVKRLMGIKRDVEVREEEMRALRLRMSEEDATAQEKLGEISAAGEAAELRMRQVEKVKMWIIHKESLLIDMNGALSSQSAPVDDLLVSIKKYAMSITAKQLVALRTEGNPTVSDKLVTEALCLCMGYNYGYGLSWEDSVKTIRRPTFLPDFQRFHPEHLSERAADQVRRDYLTQPGFGQKQIEKGCKVTAHLAEWVNAVLRYSGLVAPLKNAVKAIEDLKSDILEARDKVLEMAEFEREQHKIVSSIESEYAALNMIARGTEGEISELKIQVNRLESVISSITTGRQAGRRAVMSGASLEQAARTAGLTAGESLLDSIEPFPSLPAHVARTVIAASMSGGGSPLAAAMLGAELAARACMKLRLSVALVGDSAASALKIEGWGIEAQAQAAGKAAGIASTTKGAGPSQAAAAALDAAVAVGARPGICASIAGDAAGSSAVQAGAAPSIAADAAKAAVVAAGGRLVVAARAASKAAVEAALSGNGGAKGGGVWLSAHCARKAVMACGLPKAKAAVIAAEETALAVVQHGAAHISLLKEAGEAAAAVVKEMGGTTLEAAEVAGRAAGSANLGVESEQAGAAAFAAAMAGGASQERAAGIGGIAAGFAEFLNVRRKQWGGSEDEKEEEGEDEEEKEEDLEEEGGPAERSGAAAATVCKTLGGSALTCARVAGEAAAAVMMRAGGTVSQIGKAAYVAADKVVKGNKIPAGKSSLIAAAAAGWATVEQGGDADSAGKAAALVSKMFKTSVEGQARIAGKVAGTTAIALDADTESATEVIRSVAEEVFEIAVGLKLFEDKLVPEAVVHICGDVIGALAVSKDDCETRESLAQASGVAAAEAVRQVGSDLERQAQAAGESAASAVREIEANAVLKVKGIMIDRQARASGECAGHWICRHDGTPPEAATAAYLAAVKAKASDHLAMVISAEAAGASVERKGGQWPEAGAAAASAVEAVGGSHVELAEAGGKAAGGAAIRGGLHQRHSKSRAAAYAGEAAGEALISRDYLPEECGVAAASGTRKAGGTLEEIARAAGKCAGECCEKKGGTAAEVGEAARAAASLVGVSDENARTIAGVAAGVAAAHLGGQGLAVGAAAAETVKAAGGDIESQARVAGRAARDAVLAGGGGPSEAGHYAGEAAKAADGGGRLEALIAGEAAGFVAEKLGSTIPEVGAAAALAAIAAGGEKGEEGCEAAGLAAEAAVLARGGRQTEADTAKFHAEKAVRPDETDEEKWARMHQENLGKQAEVVKRMEALAKEGSIRKGMQEGIREKMKRKAKERKAAKIEADRKAAKVAAEALKVEEEQRIRKERKQKEEQKRLARLYDQVDTEAEKKPSLSSAANAPHTLGTTTNAASGPHVVGEADGIDGANPVVSANSPSGKKGVTFKNGPNSPILGPQSKPGSISPPRERHEASSSPPREAREASNSPPRGRGDVGQSPLLGEKKVRRVSDFTLSFDPAQPKKGRRGSHSPPRVPKSPRPWETDLETTHSAWWGRTQGNTFWMKP